ncbi:MAG: hypothetical protein CVV47_03210 [Spirochaetae bacterium HGW-Spirochaetae-3]|nr:MAG: hypothetical protein CVV47_03210 [Spirochaetae bacterium HGW-Spirochaetae-3]
MSDVEKKTILIVEDERIVAMAEKSSLEKRGYAVITVGSGERAIELIRETPGIDLVLMDIDLGGGMDGTEAAEILLRDRDLPVVFLSSHTSTDIVGKTESISSYGYVVKSSSDAILDASIKMAFRLFEAKRQLWENRQELESLNESLVASRDDMAKNEALLRDRLETILNPGLDISSLDLGAFVDIGEIQLIMDAFSRLTGMVTAVLDIKGNVLVSTGWRDICVNFHRKNPATEANCTESDCFLARNLKKGEYIDYKCGNGLWDVVTPLFLGEKHFGNIFSGQFFYDTDAVGEEYFIQQAERYGFEKESYIRALRRVPRYDRSTIRNLMDYLVAYFTQVSKSSYANIVLAKQSFDLESVKESLRKSEETLRYVLDSIPQSVFWKDLAGVYRGCNRAFAQTVGFSDPGDVIGRTDFDLSWPKTDALAYRADDANVISSKIAMKHIVEQVQASNGGRMWVDTTKLPMSHDDGNVYGVLGVYEDITARKDAEERIASLLAEKELILKEVHHRIKNNMSTMVGLLALQASRLADPSAVAALEDARRSMQSMGFLYDRLYNSEGFSELPVRTYLGSLVDEILGNFPGIGTVTVEKRIDEFVLDAGRLQPIGIILNELLTNVMKYAFGDGGGNIVVSAELKAGRVSIAVRDDGVGIPESIGIGRTAGFGLTLVGALAEQLRGVVRIERERGTAVVLEFDL